MSKILKVVEQIEEVVGRFSNEDDYEAYENVAISVLDSEFDNFPDGVLERFLRVYLRTIKAEISNEA